MMRGIGRGELCIVTGRAHSSKTQLLLNSVVNNPTKRVLWITPDEMAELVLIKLVTMVHELDPIELEKAVKLKDQSAIDTLHEFASTSMPNLMVVDRTPTVVQMGVALTEAENAWGAPADLVVFDFLELLPGDGDARGVQRKADELKRFGKERDVPLAVVHQTGRAGDRGRAAGMDAMKYGGEQQAMFVLEVFRKREDQTETENYRETHANTATVNVAKNKRPPSATGVVDLFLDPRFGTMREMQDGDVGTPLAGRKQMSYGGTAPDGIRRMEPDAADDYRERMGYPRIHNNLGEF